MSIFSKRLEAERKKAGWTKTYTAKMLKLPLTTYANYEYGVREPDINTISVISNLFNTTNDYLMGKVDNPNSSESNNVTDTDLDSMLDNAHSYDGKPMNDHDREIIKTYLKGYFQGKN